MITDCIFDFYGTLVDVHTDEDREELWISLAEEFGPQGLIDDPMQLRETYHSLVREEDEKLKALYPDRQGEICLDKVFAALFPARDLKGCDPLVREVGHRFRELSLDHFHPYDGAADMLAALRAAGKRVWPLSNAQRIFTESEIERAGLGNSFDGIYLSSDYGVKKPDPRFFRILLEEQGIMPQNAVMTGNDGSCDVRGAKQLGIAALYLHSETSPETECGDADVSLEYPDMQKVKEILLQSTISLSAEAEVQ